MNELNEFLGGRSKPTVRGEITIDTQSILIVGGIVVVSGIALIMFYRLLTMSDRVKS